MSTFQEKLEGEKLETDIGHFWFFSCKEEKLDLKDMEESRVLLFCLINFISGSNKRRIEGEG